MDCLRDKFVQGRLLDGRYLTVTPLNHGSFGMVFLATDTVTGEQVAIKCLSKNSSDLASLPVDERSEEMECHTRLGYHPNLVNMLNAFETNSHKFLVLEYCSMGDLYEAIRVKRGPLETEHVRDFMLQLIGAVEHMHSKGLFHRDIKPENIFLCQDGSMKLGDFGLATSANLSMEACVGSDRYMAPEQYEPRASGYSPAQADIWSIGICLLNILFSKNPFVTPTQSDVLFADYFRDRQSLFDIFPNMSQDTFEVLTHSLAIDPKKRSLAAMRQAILRVVSFTTDDEILDDFCTEDRDVVPASACREPLRTPSIQSPQINQGDAFPWAKALQSTPQQPVRQLSVIPDDYNEDLFASSAEDGKSWYTSNHFSPSMVSTFESSLAPSFKATLPKDRFRRFQQPSQVSGSLPAAVGMPIPSMSLVFGKGKEEQVSKSWSDLWEEDHMEEAEIELRNRQAQNARTWSQESKNDQPTSSPGLTEIDPASSIVNSRSMAPNPNNSNRDPVTVRHRGTGLRGNDHGFDGSPAASKSVPSKKLAVDKWAALGQKRRNFQPRSHDAPQWRAKQFVNRNWRQDAGPSSSVSDNEHWTRSKGSSPKFTKTIRQQPYMLSKDWRHDPYQTIKAKKDVCPFATYDSYADDEFDFIGGWHDLHI